MFVTCCFHFCTHLEVELGANETTVSNTSRDVGEQLHLNCSVAKVPSLPWLHWLKLTPNQSLTFIQNNNVITEKIGTFKELRNSSHGNVEYTVNEVTKEDEGHYVCVATSKDHVQTLKSVVVRVAGKNFSRSALIFCLGVCIWKMEAGRSKRKQILKNARLFLVN